jgi:hypothetical protein
MLPETVFLPMHDAVISVHGKARDLLSLNVHVLPRQFGLLRKTSWGPAKRFPSRLHRAQASRVHVTIRWWGVFTRM